MVTKLVPSRIAPRRPPGTKGRRSPRFPDLDFQALGKFLGITPTHTGRILNGHCRPSMKIAEKLGALMGWTIDDVNSLYVEQHKEQKQNQKVKSNGKSGNSSKGRIPGTTVKRNR